MSDLCGPCCRCFCSFTFTLGLTALFMWLSLRPSKPKCFLQQIYIPTLNQTLNTTLFFELKLENTNKDKGVYYDPVNVTFFDSPNRTHLIGNFTIPKFYQGHKKKAMKPGQINDTRLDRKAVLRAVSNGLAVFRVDISTSVRYKILAFATKRHRISVGAYVNISDQGTQVNYNPKKPIRLSSSVDKIGSSRFGKIGIFLIQFLVFGLIDLW
ncbi:protein NDR1 [Jatropha curcas]|uniref:protein NDR1 n=1 Tax=Jatropha curcas TaxID=180498 RepID=UPI001894AFAB|nr:protein NDR1 [Jatropha curcas]